MTKNAAQKKKIRARMAETGEPYAEAARRLAEADPGGETARWVLVTLANARRGEGRGIEGIDRADLEAMALAAAQGYHYRLPCPVVTMFPLFPQTGEDAVLVGTRLQFADDPRQALALDESDLSGLIGDIRHALVMRGRRAVSVDVRPATEAEVAEWAARSESADGHAARSPEIAERDWSRRALVQLVRDVTASSPGGDRPTVYRAGDVLPLWQTGRRGWPVDRGDWTTNLDIDLYHVIPNEAAQVVEILEDTPPFAADPQESDAERYARRWARMARLFESAARDATMTAMDWKVLHNHRADLTRELCSLVRSMRFAKARPQLGVLAVAADIIEQIPPPEWADPDHDGQARALADQLRALAADPGVTDAAELRAVLARAEEAIEQAVGADGGRGWVEHVDRPAYAEAKTRLGASVRLVQPGTRD